MATDIAPLPAASQSVATVLCCECGIPIEGTIAGAICESCLRTKVDVTTGIQREAQIHSCRGCDRVFSPPSAWVVAAPESRELLALCLRKLRGLTKTRLIEANFLVSSSWLHVSIQYQNMLNFRITVDRAALEKSQNTHYHPDRGRGCHSTAVFCC